MNNGLSVLAGWQAGGGGHRGTPAGLVPVAEDLQLGAGLFGGRLGAGAGSEWPELSAPFPGPASSSQRPEPSLDSHGG